MPRIDAIIIGSRRVPIRYRDEMAEYGLFSESPLEMHIRSAEPGWKTASTILHESIHAIDAIYNLRLEEEQVAGLEVALVDLIRSNPQLIAKICK